MPTWLRTETRPRPTGRHARIRSPSRTNFFQAPCRVILQKPSNCHAQNWSASLAPSVCIGQRWGSPIRYTEDCRLRFVPHVASQLFAFTVWTFWARFSFHVGLICHALPLVYFTMVANSIAKVVSQQLHVRASIVRKNCFPCFLFFVLF